MRKKSNLHKTVNSAVSTPIERFSKLKQTDRFVLFKRARGCISCEYDELEIDYLKHKQFGGSSND